MTTSEKEFMLTHDFKKISSLKNRKNVLSPIEEHFGIPWKIEAKRYKDHLGLFLHCEPELDEDKDWSIEVGFEVKFSAVIRKPVSKTMVFFKKCDHIFESTAAKSGWPKLITWEDMMKDYVIDGNLKVEFRVKIRKMTGIILSENKENLMNFDESTKEFSDVVLIVENRKFHVLKQHLARYSTFFKTLLMGKCEESGKSEVTLQNVYPHDFQNFLEVLHGEPAIDDDTVEGILKIAEMYGSPVCIKRCEQFLMEKSQKSMVGKFGISMKFELENLKEKCIAEIKTTGDLKTIVTKNIDEIDLATAKTVLRKFVSL